MYVGPVGHKHVHVASARIYTGRARPVSVSIRAMARVPAWRPPKSPFTTQHHGVLHASECIYRQISFLLECKCLDNHMAAIIPYFLLCWSAHV